MSNDKLIAIMENELRCVQRASNHCCNRVCEQCDLLMETDDVVKAYGKVIKMLETGQWILCNEKAPLPEQEILLFDDNFGIVVGKYVSVAYPDGKEYRYLIHKSIDSDLMGAINPIWWMPLPEAPKEGA